MLRIWKWIIYYCEGKKCPIFFYTVIAKGIIKMCFAVKHCGLRISTWTYKKLVDRNGEDLIDRCVCLHKKTYGRSRVSSTTKCWKMLFENCVIIFLVCNIYMFRIMCMSSIQCDKNTSSGIVTLCRLQW